MYLLVLLHHEHCQGDTKAYREKKHLLPHLFVRCMLSFSHKLQHGYTSIDPHILYRKVIDDFSGFLVGSF